MANQSTAPREDEYAERWRQWQVGNARSSRRGEIQARIVFAVVVTLAAAWLGLRLP